MSDQERDIPSAQPSAAIPDLRARLGEAHDASLDDDHRACRSILMECIRLLDAAPSPAQSAPDEITDAMLRAGLQAWRDHADFESRVALSRMYNAMRRAAPAATRPAQDVLLLAIQKLNQNPYSLTKRECIEVLQELRATQPEGQEAAWPMEQQPDGSVTPVDPADMRQEAMFRNIVWPKARDVGRIGDMSPSASMRVGLDNDNDVYVSVWGEDGGASVEFCTPGPGGGASARTREALIALMAAIEADNAERPDRDWWARRNSPAVQAGDGNPAKGGA